MANHHTHRKNCALCEEKVKTAHPTLQAWWKDIKEEFPDCHISWAFRNEEMQNLFVKEGKSRALWPTSPHNHTKDGKPCARALDLFQLGADNVARFGPGFYYKISEFILRMGAPITWSGSWKSFGETNHFELKKTHE